MVLQQLALLKGYDLDSLDPVGPDFVHLQVECAKLAFADRESFYGDPDFVEVPIETLLSDRYNAERRKLVGKQASLELRPGSVKGYGAVVEMRRADGARAAVGSLGAGEPTVGRLGEVIGDTVHFDIVDVAGNMVSSTPSGGWLQSSPVIPELGFALGTRAQMFWLDKTIPPHSRRASGRAPRCRRPWHCGWRALPRVGITWWRSAGSMDDAVLSAPRPCRHEFAGIDRRARLAFGAFPDFVLAAHRAAGRPRCRKTAARRDHQ